jgi:hypothetical protein
VSQFFFALIVEDSLCDLFVTSKELSLAPHPLLAYRGQPLPATQRTEKRREREKGGSQVGRADYNEKKEKFFFLLRTLTLSNGLWRHSGYRMCRKLL